MMCVLIHRSSRRVLFDGRILLLTDVGHEVRRLAPLLHSAADAAASVILTAATSVGEILMGPRSFPTSIHTDASASKISVA
jgi:hypothetical protein